MKKILFEYASIIAYTITGLVFGLSFFLLFLNFYHYQEVNYVANVSEYNKSNKTIIENKLNVIKENINVYDQTTYSGNLNIYGLGAVKYMLQKSVEVLESDEVLKYLDMDKIELKDSYNFVVAFKNRVLNDCLVMQVKSMFDTDTVASLPNYAIIKPYIDMHVNSLLGSVDYIQSNIENSDHYYFSTDGNKSNFFSLVDDSYTSTLSRYGDVLDLLVEVSYWYRNIVIGG